jgi:hypothetical protein
MTPEVSTTFDEWLKWAFDHPVTELMGHDQWWWHVPRDWEGGIWLDRPPERALAFVIQLFENPLAYLSCYSDAQIDQGVNFIVSRACSKHFDWLVDRRIDIGLRKRCFRSIEELFRELLAPRCSDDIWIYTKPLNHICDMFWDMVVRDANTAERDSDGTYRIVRYTDVDAEILDTLAHILAMPSVACQQSALHGLGHLVHEAKLGSNVIQKYLDDYPDLRYNLRQYARIAMFGGVL